MTQATKQAIRCTRCNKYRTHTEYKTPIDSHDDVGKPVCDQCQDAAKAMKDHRAEWSQAAETIDAALDDYRQKFGADAATTEPDYARMEKSTARFFAGIREENRKHKLSRALDFLAERRANLARAEQTRRETEALKAKTRKIRKRTALLKAQSDAIDQTIATALAENEAVRHGVEQFAIAASAQIDQMMARASAGATQVQDQRDRQTVLEAARRGREADEWTFKAGTCSDPILRSVFLARAAGQVIDDDDV